MMHRQCIPVSLDQGVNHDPRLIFEAQLTFKARLVFKAWPVLVQLHQTPGLYSRPGLYLRPGLYSRKYGILTDRVVWSVCLSIGLSVCHNSEPQKNG